MKSVHAPESATLTFSAPRWRFTRWIVDTGKDLPDDIRAALVASLYGTYPIFAGGVINSIAVSGAIALRIPTAAFIGWFILETLICTARLVLLIIARRAAEAGRPTPTDLQLVLSLCWSTSVGYGMFLCMTSGDWVSATLACLSAAAMVGGICFRNFGAPRLAGLMVLTSFGPCIPGAILSGEPIIYVVLLQVPLYIAAMSMAVFKLNEMLVTTMLAERENDRRASHDPLTGLLNREGVVREINARLATGTESSRRFALLFLDLDNFKPVNDRYGHAAGDRLLKRVSRRIADLSGADSIVGRIGGDEFVILVESPSDTHTVALAERIIAAVGAGEDLATEAARDVGVSLGIAFAPRHGADAITLMAVADAALYEAKAEGKARLAIGSLEANLEALRRMSSDFAERSGRFGAAA